MDSPTRAYATTYEGTLTGSGRPLVTVTYDGSTRPLLDYLALPDYAWGDTTDATHSLATALLLHAAGAAAAAAHADALTREILAALPKGLPWTLSHAQLRTWLDARGAFPSDPTGGSMDDSAAFVAEPNGALELKVYLQQTAAERLYLCSYLPPERPSINNLASRFAALVILTKATTRNTALDYLEAFNRDVVSRLPRTGWTLAATHIHAWLALQQAGTPPAPSLAAHS